jgi:hypothetical protein
VDLDQALRIAVNRLHSRRLMFRPVNIPGFPTFPDRQALLAFLAGPTPSGTPERAAQHYRTQARLIQRLEGGQTLTDRQRYRLEAFAAREDARRVSVSMSACIRVSSERRCRWRERMRATISVLELGDPGLFVPAFFPAYGIDSGVRVDDVGEIAAQYI